MNERALAGGESDRDWKIGVLTLSFVLITFFVYAGFLLWIIWPISEYSLNNAGVFGDSFGPLTALFSGLAFSGMIITILLQQKELRLQRGDIARTAEAQERSAKLLAVATLIEEYRGELRTLHEIQGEFTDGALGASIANQEKIQEVTLKKSALVKELERLVENHVVI